MTVIEAVAELLTVLQEKQLLQTGDATLRTRILQSVLDAVDCHGRLLAPTQEPDGTRRTSEMGSIGRTRTVGGVFRYVELLAIAEGTAADLRLSLADVTFGHYEGIILDLRSSAGTELKSAHQAVDVLAGSEVPLVVLIGRGTAGAAEVLADLSKQKCRATRLGQETSGFPFAQQATTLKSGEVLLTPQVRVDLGTGDWKPSPVRPDVWVGPGPASRPTSTSSRTAAYGSDDDECLQKAVDLLTVICALDKKHF